MKIRNLLRLDRSNKKRSASRRLPPEPRRDYGAVIRQAEAISAFMEQAEDPDLLLQQAGWKRHDLRKLESDDEIKGVLETRLDALLSTPWRLEPGDDDVVSALARDLEPKIESIIRAAWQAVPFGYSVTELTWRVREDGSYTVEKAVEAKMERFRPTRDGRLLAKGAAGEWVEADPRFHLLTLRWATERNPYGEALLSRAYWPWFFRHNAWLFWMRYLERFGDPLLLASVMSPADFLAEMQKFGVENIVAVGQGESIEAVTKSSGAEFEKVETALTRRVQKLILGQTLTSDVTGKGSYAAAKVHNMVRMDKRNADIRLVSPTVQRVIDLLWAFNNHPGDPPRFVMEDSAGIQKERSERDAILMNAGVRLTRSYFLRAYDYEDEDIAEIVTNGASGNGEAAFSRVAIQPQAPAIFAASSANDGGQTFTPEQQRLEDGVQELMAAGQPITPDALRSAALGATDEEDLADRLAVILGRDAPQFQTALEQAMLVAQVLGTVDAENKRIE